MADKDKEKTTPFTWVVTIIVAGLVFTITKNIFENKPYLLFESSKDKRARIMSECRTEGFERAESLRDSNLRILKAKSNPTPQELAEIERLEGWQTEGLASREEIEYHYKQCMDRYGY